jgi:hypothetical protein
MGNPLRSLTTLNHRLDHDLFEDVGKVHYREGIIEDFGVSNTSLFTLDDTCTVNVEGYGSFRGVPIFYHCRPGYYDSTVGTKRDDNKGLHHSAWGFRAGQKVVVMMREEAPVAVLHHNERSTYKPDDKAPWKCLDIFRFQWHRSIGSGRTTYRPPQLPVTPGWLNWFMFQEEWHSIHYRCTTQEEFSAIDEAPVEPDGDVVELPHRAKHIFGMREQQFGTMVYYLGDWMIVVGPVAYFLSVYGIGMPAPITGSVSIRAGIWTPERDAIWLENARLKEQVYGTGDGWRAFNTTLITDFPYVDTYHQAKFTATFMNRFYLTGGGMAPKWILTEFWLYDWDRVASIPGTPNTPAG